METLGQGVLSDLGTIVNLHWGFFICDNGVQGSAYHEAVVGSQGLCFVWAHTTVLKRVEVIGVRTCFKVHGDAYIDGYMNSEGTKEVKEGQIQLTECVTI